MGSAAIGSLRGTMRFSSFDDDDGVQGGRRPFRPADAARDELPFRIELWDEARETVEAVLAIAAHGTIAYAAFYAAAREHPQRYITLCHDKKVLSRWNGGH